MERIGVIGLGRMGAAIAQRMVSQGRVPMGWTRSNRPVDGVPTVSDLAALVDRSDVLILSLLDDTAVETVLEGLLTNDLDGKLIIDTSTVVPHLLTDREDRFAAKGAAVVDAPISGGPELVLAGKCGVFIGGTDPAAQRAQACLSAISDRQFHVGPLGTGLVMKVINNSMIQTYFAGLGEMMPLARRAGLPLEMAVRILTGGPAGMSMVADRIPKILGQDNTVGFALSAVHKDNDVFQRVLGSFGLSSPLLELAGAQQRRALAAGLDQADPAALVPFAYDTA